MGNMCSKSSNKDDNFSTPGRPLGSSTAAANNNNPRTPVPQKVVTGNTATTSSPGRALGSRDGTTTTSSPSDAKAAAARAAEERANATTNKPGGKLQSQLDAQRKKTQGQTLTGASEAERLARQADENAERRNWN